MHHNGTLNGKLAYSVMLLSWLYRDLGIGFELVIYSYNHFRGVLCVSLHHLYIVSTNIDIVYREV